MNFRTITLLALLLAAATCARAEVTVQPTGAFSFSISADVKGTPEQVFDAATGDITPWWDHTMSGHPVRMYVEPKPGGAFMEIFNEEGDGVRHAVVTGAERGKLLRYEGAMGLAGFALNLVTTWTFEAAGEGRTTVTVTVHGAGELQHGWPEVIEQTWRHFLVERFQAYLEK